MLPSILGKAAEIPGKEKDCLFSRQVMVRGCDGKMCGAKAAGHLV